MRVPSVEADGGFLPDKEPTDGERRQRRHEDSAERGLGHDRVRLSNAADHPPTHKILEDSIRTGIEARALAGLPGEPVASPTNANVPAAIRNRLDGALGSNRIAGHRRSPLVTGSRAPEGTPAQTAERIARTVSGPILDRYIRAHPGASGMDLESFRHEVLRGFEEGLSDARRILAALTGLEEPVRGAIAETGVLARARLDELFDAIDG